MRDTYYEKHELGLSVLDLQRIDVRLESYEPHDVRLLITRLNVAHRYRGQGVATRLMTECCADADREGETLWLECSPYPDTDPVRLRLLYERHGFTETDIPGFFTRPPNTKE